MSLPTRLHLLVALVCALTGTLPGILAAIALLLLLAGRHAARRHLSGSGAGPTSGTVCLGAFPAAQQPPVLDPPGRLGKPAAR